MDEVIRGVSGRDFLIVMGDFNAVVGKGREGLAVGEYGLGKRNDRGEMLIERCRQWKLIVSNTWFRHENRRRYTWKNPGDTTRYQIDYILVRHRYRNSVTDSRSYPGADVDSDHNLVAAKFKIRLKKIRSRTY